MDILANDTIVAPATPSGEGAVAIIRLSGPAAEHLLGRVFSPSCRQPHLASHHLYHGRIRAQGELVDEVMAVVMRAPRSYTREDVVEIHCHGGGQVQRRILDLLIQDGARLARPGEFTLRAFLNGRIDLTEAEGVIDLIRARSESARQVAARQLEGNLSRLLHGFRDSLVDLLSQVEAHIDFPEEEVPVPSLAEWQREASAVCREMDHLLETFEAGRVLREGLAVLILGRPNVGKSSLLNALLGEARAIVTEIPGTTRDTVEETLVLEGIPLRLIDTAGVREARDPVEAEGVRRAREKVAAADLVLLVLDGSRPPTDEDRLALEAVGGARCLLVLNKADRAKVPIPAPFSTLPSLRVSARTGEGMAQLRQGVVAPFLAGSGGEAPEGALISDRRHRQALVRARESLERYLAGLEEQQDPEFLSLELRDALAALGEITGETTPEEVLERIFNRFCIGK